MTTLAPTPDKILDITKLPALPQALDELNEACDSIEVDIVAVAKIVAREPGISARILQLANSVLFGARNVITEIDQAVVYLGIDTVRNLAISVSVHEVFSGQKSVSGFSLPQFWHHSLHVAILAKMLAEEAGYPKPAEAYLAGLVHDIGKLLLLCNFPEQFNNLLRDSSARDITEKEILHIGISHSQAAAMLIRSWKLDGLARVVEEHHYADCLTNPPINLASLLATVHKLFDEEEQQEHSQWMNEQTVFKQENLRQLIDAARSTIEDMASMLGIQVEAPAVSSAKDSKISGSEKLASKVISYARIQGLLNNLLTAKDSERLYRVIEQSLAILFNIQHSLFLLPDSIDGAPKFCASPYNQANKFCNTASLAFEESLLIMRCQTEKSFVHIPRTASREQKPVDVQLLQLFGTAIIAAIPLPLGPGQNGFLVIGVSEQGLKNLQEANQTLAFFAAHAAGRIQLELIKTQHAQEMAERELQVAQNIARGILHDIANPLSTIQNYVSIVEMKSQTGEPLAETLQRLTEEVERAGVATRQLASLAEATQADSSESLDLNLVIGQVVEGFQKAAPKTKSLNFILDLSDDIVKFTTSSHGIRQVMSILLHNAVSAIETTGDIIVSTYLEPGFDNLAPGKLCLRVADTGESMNSNEIAALFSSSGASGSDSFANLTLRTLQRRLKAMGGSIICSRRVPQGNQFIVSFPLLENSLSF